MDPVSEGFQAHSPEDCARTLDLFGRGRRDTFERIVDSKLLPFESAHLVKWQDVHSLHVA